MTYRTIEKKFYDTFPDAHFWGSDPDGDDVGMEELLAFIFDIANVDEPKPDTTPSGPVSCS
jgi:hypothetical protein